MTEVDGIHYNKSLTALLKNLIILLQRPPMLGVGYNLQCHALPALPLQLGLCLETNLHRR